MDKNFLDGESSAIAIYVGYLTSFSFHIGKHSTAAERHWFWAGKQSNIRGARCVK